MAGRKSNVDKELVIDLFKKGLTYRAIAAEVNSTEDAIRMLIKRNAASELSKKKEAREIKGQAKTDDPAYFITDQSNSKVLDVEARIQILNEKRKY